MRCISGKLLYFLLSVQLIILAVSGTSANAQSRLQQLDDRIMINLMEHRTPEQTGVFMFLSKHLEYGNIGVPVTLLAVGAATHDQQMRQNALYVASSTLLTSGITFLIKQVVKRPRPFIQNIHIVPVYRADNYSFPSGHTSSSFSTATALSMAYPKWYVIAPAFLWAGSVSYSRMYLGVHYPTDVAAGALLGVSTAASLQFIRR